MPPQKVQLHFYTFIKHFSGVIHKDSFPDVRVSKNQKDAIIDPINQLIIKADDYSSCEDAVLKLFQGLNGIREGNEGTINRSFAKSFYMGVLPSFEPGKYVKLLQTIKANDLMKNFVAIANECRFDVISAGYELNSLINKLYNLM
eukprot:TRINITY_DN9753_c0_g3_i6.p1 TRINITY_DN9753_c0_g3~~TRINITY_DN9753_c0_g3_i6.p1  ORF type:complete len:145 (-),score=19.30 TRINITY_DN9753_c0_g3_i6:174-608(-)